MEVRITIPIFIDKKESSGYAAYEHFATIVYSNESTTISFHPIPVRSMLSQ